MPCESVRQGGTASRRRALLGGGQADTQVLGLLLVSFGEWELQSRRLVVQVLRHPKRKDRALTSGGKGSIDTLMGGRLAVLAHGS